MVLSDTVNDLILSIGHATYILLSSNFALFPQHYLIDLHHTWHTWDSRSVSLCPIFQRTCLISSILFDGFTSCLGKWVRWTSQMIGYNK